MSYAPGIPDFEIQGLALLQRILVTTDGTVTDVLAAAFLEPIELVKLSVTVAPCETAVETLDLRAGSMTMHRRIILRGARSGVKYAYAEVLIAADRLTPALRHDLLEGRTPLGQLWLSHRLETWKERPRVRRRQADGLADHLDVSPQAAVIERTYRTFTGGVPVFAVTEFFPEDGPAHPR
jgi:chorismate-pyruvate lyase